MKMERLTQEIITIIANELDMPKKLLMKTHKNPKFEES